MATDWRLTAERAGNTILAVNRDRLIFVEGTGCFQGNCTWWGGELAGAAQFTAQMNGLNKLVQSVHEYQADVANQPWFSDPTFPADMAAIWAKNWALLQAQGIAPVWIVEFGTLLDDNQDVQWIPKAVSGDNELDNQIMPLSAARARYPELNSVMLLVNTRPGYRAQAYEDVHGSGRQMVRYEGIQPAVAVQFRQREENPSPTRGDGTKSIDVPLFERFRIADHERFEVRGESSISPIRRASAIRAACRVRRH
jgi:Cellulase (glycosyl hydrolase family 5)